MIKNRVRKPQEFFFVILDLKMILLRLTVSGSFEMIGTDILRKATARLAPVLAVLK